MATSNECNGKYSYTTFTMASKAAKNQRRRKDIVNKVYKCIYCKYFHVGQVMGNKMKRKLEIIGYE